MNGDRSRYYAMPQPPTRWASISTRLRLVSPRTGSTCCAAPGGLPRPTRPTGPLISGSSVPAPRAQLGATSTDRKARRRAHPAGGAQRVWQAITKGAKAIGYFTHSWECDGYTQFCLSAEQKRSSCAPTHNLRAHRAHPSARYEESVTVNSSRTPASGLARAARRLRGNAVSPSTWSGARLR